MFAIAVDSQVCQKERRRTEGLLRSPNTGLAVMTVVVTCKQMLEDNHGYVHMSMQSLTRRRRKYLTMYYLNTNSVMFMCKIPSTNNLNGPLRGYSIEYKEEGKSLWTTVNVSHPSTEETLQSLKKWTVYFIRIAVSNGDFLGPPGPEKQVRTLEDGLYTP